MHFDNLQPGLSAPLPRSDDDDDDDDDEKEAASAKKGGAPVGLLIQKKFLEQRKIFLWGAVTDETAKDITEKLLYLETTGPGKEITFYINSPGGSVDDTLAMYDTMKFLTCDVQTFCIGQAMSGGAVILAAGTKGKRYALPNANVMIQDRKSVV